MLNFFISRFHFSNDENALLCFYETVECCCTSMSKEAWFISLISSISWIHITIDFCMEVLSHQQATPDSETAIFSFFQKHTKKKMFKAINFVLCCQQRTDDFAFIYSFRWWWWFYFENGLFVSLPSVASRRLESELNR